MKDLIKTYITPANVLTLLKQLFGEKFRDVLNDPRSQLEKLNDYKVGTDVILTASASAEGKRITKLPFKAYNQGKSSACGAFAASHARRLFEGEQTFPYQWYRARTNYDYEGMYLKDVLKLMAQAMIFEPKKAYNTLTEKEANALAYTKVYDEKRKDKYEYAQIDSYDADSIFSAVNEGYPVVFAFYSTVNEWKEIMEPTDVVTLFTAPVRHFVVALPNSTHLKNGKEWLSVIDSSPNKGFSLRHVSKDFIKQRSYLGAGFYYPSKTRKTKVTVVPQKAVKFGDNNAFVLDLQMFLYQTGYLSKVHTTSYYGPKTAQAVLTWQADNLLNVPMLELFELKGRYWGPKSIKRANELHN
jgi:hypothetical protein